MNPLTSYYFEKRENKIVVVFDFRNENGEKVSTTFDDIDILCQHGASVEMACAIFDEADEIKDIDSAWDRIKELSPEYDESEITIADLESGTFDPSKSLNLED